MSESEPQITTQEINALRKSGKLEEALRHARAHHKKDPEDPWVVRTLFWCLHDEFKRLRTEKDSDATAAVAKEVEGLKMPVEGSDQVMHDCAARILGSDPIAKATQLSKDGNHHDAVALLRPIAHAQDATARVGEAYGWILYRKLRDGGAEQPDIAFWCLNEFLACWNHEWEPNGMLFKCLLIQAKIHADGWNGLVPLVEKLGLHRMSAEEFADDRPDSDFEPFQDQLLTAIHKCLKGHPLLHGERPALHQLLAAWKDSFGDGEWPQYHLGKILIWTGGDLDQARDLLLKTVQRNPGDFWRWQAFAETLSGDETKAALSRGILCHGEDGSFKVPLYRDYAELLANEGELAAAKASLDEAMRLRQLSGNEWREPAPGWVSEVPVGDTPDIHKYAEPFAANADELLAASIPSRQCILIRPLQKENRFLYYCIGDGTRSLKFRSGQAPPPEVGMIEAKFEDKENGVCIVLAWQETEALNGMGETEIGVVGHVNAEKQLASVATPTQEFIPLFFDRWPKASVLMPGTFLNLQWLDQPDNKPIVITWESSEPTMVPGFLLPVKGTFELSPGNSFGFITMAGRKIFVPPKEARGLEGHAQATGWAMRSSDKHGRPSWKLLPKQS